MSKNSNTKKLQEAILYICDRTINPTELGAIKLNKILWKSDVEHYLTTGKSITDTVYTKQKMGPVPKYLPIAKEQLVKSNKIKEKESVNWGYPQKILIAIASPNIDIFSKEELIQLEDNRVQICQNHTASTISAESHDLIWESATIGEEIPLYAYLAGEIGDITEDDKNWAREMLKGL